MGFRYSHRASVHSKFLAEMTKSMCESLFAADGGEIYLPLFCFRGGRFPQKNFFKPVVRLTTVRISSGRETIGLAVKSGGGLSDDRNEKP